MGEARYTALDGSRECVSRRLVASAALVAALLVLTSKSYIEYRAPTRMEVSTDGGGGRGVEGTASREKAGEEEVLEYRIGILEMASHPDVREYLVGRGADVTDADSLSKYLPTSLTVTVRPALVKQDLGDEALDGHVAFGMYYPGRASYVMIVNLSGEIERMYPTANFARSSHVDAVKPRDDDWLLLTSNYNMSENGTPFRWRWRGDEVVALSDYQSSHDVQWSWKEPETIFVVTYNGVERVDAAGDVREVHHLDTAAGVNHIQVSGNETFVILSSRFTNGVVAYDIRRNVTNWIAGGEYGTLTLVDTDGTVHSPDAELWAGQHNAEYFGQGEIFMFDNMYKRGESSRALIVEIDETAGTATEVWDYTFAPLPEGYTPVFGDLDLLPSGNVLTSWWPMELSDRVGDADVRVLEITRSHKQIAFELQITGSGCESSCTRSIDKGWKMYSVERFYDRPLIHAVTCASGLPVSFRTHNTFKQNEAFQASFSITSQAGTLLHTGTFDFQPYWRPTLVETGFLYDPDDGELLITVTNQFGTVSRVTSCDPSSR